MRILLQSFETGLYLDTSGTWTDTAGLAQSFRSTRQAAEFKMHRRLTEAFVVLLPDPAPPAEVTGTHHQTIGHAQKPAGLVGSQAAAIQSKMTREGGPARRKSTMARQRRVLNGHPCNLSI